MKQAVDSQRLLDTAAVLRKTDGELTREMDSLKRTVERMANTWRSGAGDRAIQVMYQLFKNNDARSTVLQNYINFLEQMAVPGLVNAEDVNTKLADQFK